MHLGAVCCLGKCARGAYNPAGRVECPCSCPVQMILNENAEFGVVWLTSVHAGTPTCSRLDPGGAHEPASDAGPRVCRSVVW